MKWKESEEFLPMVSNLPASFPYCMYGGEAFISKMMLMVENTTKNKTYRRT